MRDRKELFVNEQGELPIGIELIKSSMWGWIEKKEHEVKFALQNTRDPSRIVERG